MPGYYPDPPSDDSNEHMGADKPKMDESAETETFLTPKSATGGKEAKPGDEFVFEVVRVYDDEIEWKYATGDKEDKSKSTMDESMDDMDEKYGMKE